MKEFDEVIQRKYTHSLKYDGIEGRFGISGENLLPLWVADMDFKTPEVIRDALMKYIKNGALGYSGGYDDAYESLINWFKRRHGLGLEKSWIEFSGTVVSSLARIIKTFTNEGDKILLQPPVFSNFYDLIKRNNRIIVENPLILKDGEYTMDFEHLKSVIDSDVKMIILCNPHNPVGRSWTHEELKCLSDIMVKNNILIVSDDVHCELVHDGYKHNFILNCGEEAKANSITCVASHKTFNMAGLEISNVIIPNKDIMAKYKVAIHSEGINKPNLLGLIALKAGLDKGEPWLREVMEYIQDNFKFLEEYLKKYLPESKVIKAQATFLAWVDLNAVGLESKEIEDLLVNKGQLLVNQGYTFGIGGEGFIRLNLACPRSILEEALERLVKSFEN